MLEKINLLDLIKKHRVSVLVLSIIGILLGILCVISPFAFGAILVWVIIGLIGVLGIASVVKFIVPGKGNKREGASLALGIIFILVVTALILIGVLGKEVIFEGTTYTAMEALTVRMLGFFSIFFGIFSLISNLFLLCSINRVEDSGKGFVVAKAILGIVIGVLMVVFPFFMFGLNILIAGIYFIFMSIVSLITVIKYWKTGKKEENYNL